MTTEQRRNVLFKCLLVLFSVLFSLFLAEAALRCCKYKPLRKIHLPNEVPMHQPDPELGWLPKPGAYKLKPFTPEGKEIAVTFWPNEARATAQQPNPRKRRIVLIGCSFTMGWAISDEDTFAWKLQQRYPDIEFVNLGCDGYSAYQSLLRLERYFKSDDAQGHVHLAVIYGFLEDQVQRNVASADWLQTLSEYMRRGHAALPYCDYSAKNATLIRMPPVSCPRWPLQYKSSLIHGLLHMYLNVSAHGRYKWRYEVMKQVISEINRECAEHGTRLVAPILRVGDKTIGKAAAAAEKNVWVQYFHDSNIPTIDASDGIDVYKTPYYVPVDGHPNGFLNTIWAERLDRMLIKSGIVPAGEVKIPWPDAPQS